MKKNPKFRQSLPSLYTTRAFKNGSRSLGQKSWYKENFDIHTRLKSNTDRRKFRFRLKSNVDCLIQLDLESLKACLLDKTFNPTVSTTRNNTNPISNGSFLDTLRKMDYTRFQKFCTILNRIQGNLEFSQALSEYFATDDMVEPALLVVAAANRLDINLAKSLRGGSVAANALMYRHRASPRDYDFSARTSTLREPRTQNSHHCFLLKLRVEKTN